MVTHHRKNHQRKETEREGLVNKEVFTNEHRKSQDRRTSSEEKPAILGVALVVHAWKAGEETAEAVRLRMRARVSNLACFSSMRLFTF